MECILKEKDILFICRQEHLDSIVGMKKELLRIAPSATIYGIKDWDEYLTFKFGNYWILPEQEKRKTHPITKLKL